VTIKSEKRLLKKVKLERRLKLYCFAWKMTTSTK